jgi:heme o synthase
MPRSQKTGITPKPSAHRAFKPIRQIREPDVLRQFLFHSGFSKGEIRTTAFSGAIPPLTNRLGRRTGHLNKEAAVLYAIVAVPPFMAIAWMYREDYVRAGYLIFPANGEERFSAWITSIPSLALFMVGLRAVSASNGGAFQFSATVILGSGLLYYAMRQVFLHSRIAARQLLMATIVYLPLQFLIFVLAKN